MCGTCACLDEEWNILTRTFLQLHKNELAEVQVLAQEHNEQPVKLCSMLKYSSTCMKVSLEFANTVFHSSLFTSIFCLFGKLSGIWLGDVMKVRLSGEAEKGKQEWSKGYASKKKRVQLCCRMQGEEAGKNSLSRAHGEKNPQLKRNWQVGIHNLIGRWQWFFWCWNELKHFIWYFFLFNLFFT